MDNTLYVITAIFNPWRYQSRIKLYRDFEKYILDAGAKLYTVELAFNQRDFTVTHADDKTDIQLRTSTELWHKERMLNLAIQRLPAHWKYVAWIDSDVIFTRPDWVNETVQLLQHYPIIQMFSQAADLSAQYEILKIHTGIIEANLTGKTFNQKYDNYHPGFAWAATRQLINDIGGIFDTAILGAGDRHMACALLDKVEVSMPKGLHPDYIDALMTYQGYCKKYVKKNVGFMPGALIHYWHGKKVDRQYVDRWKILIKNQYSPKLDLKLDSQGLYQFTDRNPTLKYDIRKYFQTRNEDSIDL